MKSALLVVLVGVVGAFHGASPQERPSVPLAAEVGRISAATTNEQRFEALTAILRERDIAFAVEPFTIDKPIGREPRIEARNIVVTVGEAEATIVIGSHYDAARLPDGSLSRGAVDNAASSVILVRLAEMLRTERLPLRIRIVWFDMEELGLIGSQRYVERHAAERNVAMLNFDINAYGETIVFGPSERSGNAALRKMLVQTCAKEEISCVPFPQMPPGDDRSFVNAAIPTLSVAILPAIDAHQLWLMMNAGAASGLARDTSPAILRTIHTNNDTPEKVDDAAMAKVLRFGASLVRTVAGMTGAPSPAPPLR